MGDWPTATMPAPFVVSTYHAESLHVTPRQALSAAPSSGVTVQNNAYFFPFRIDTGATASAIGVINGATLNGNIDVGIYDDEFNLLVSTGSVAVGGFVSSLNSKVITSTLLNPGTYWMAYATGSATNTVFRVVATDEVAVPSQNALVQATAFPLPNPATPTRDTAASPVVVIAMAVSFLGGVF